MMTSSSTGFSDGVFMYVSDPDDLYKKAIEAGATSVFKPTARDWGEGGELVPAAGVKDLCGNLLLGLWSPARSFLRQAPQS